MWEEDWPWEAETSPPRVLVAVVPTLADWARVCDEHWYRIPLRCAPRQLGAEYLAFYHPKCFSDLRWSIRYYTPILRYRLVRRDALLPEQADHPRAAELYYKIELGPLEELPRPIPSHSLRRVTFIATDLEALLQAREIKELWAKGRKDPKESLWQGTRR